MSYYLLIPSFIYLFTNHGTYFEKDWAQYWMQALLSEMGKELRNLLIKKKYI